MADTRADFPGFLSNVVGPRFGRGAERPQPWGLCVKTGLPHPAAWLNCPDCDERRP